MDDSLISRLDSRVSELEQAIRQIKRKVDEVASFAARTDRRLERTDGLVSDLQSAHPQVGAVSSARILDEMGRESAERRKQERERLIATRTGREGN
jgi:hypothetical protein